MILKSDALNVGNASVLGQALSELETNTHAWNAIIK